MNSRIVKRAVHYGLTALIIIMLFSGFGITEYRTVEPLTAGVFTQGGAFWLHSLLAIPFAVLLAVHMYITLGPRRRKKGGKSAKNKTA